jgi:hypothetical protein
VRLDAPASLRWFRIQPRPPPLNHQESNVKNLKIGVRLGAGFAIVLALLLAVTITAVLRMQEAGDMTSRLVQVSIKNQRNEAEWGKQVELNTAMLQTAYVSDDNAIVDMDSVTQQNAALAEQAAAAAESMQGQAERLAQVVSTFKLDDAGGAPLGPRSAPGAQLALAAA